MPYLQHLTDWGPEVVEEGALYANVDKNAAERGVDPSLPIIFAQARRACVARRCGDARWRCGAWRTRWPLLH